MDKFIEKEIEKQEEIVIPNSINIKLDKTYEAIRQDNVPKKHNRSYKFKKIALAASLVFVIFSVIAINPALAENVPGLSQLLNYFESNDNYISHTDKMNITQKDKGIEINLEGVICDESSLKFIYTLTSEKKLQWGVQFGKNSLKINGKNIKDDRYRVQTDDIKISSDNEELEKYAVITTVDVSDLKLDDKVDIDWDINEIHIWDNNYENGNWRFNFKTSKEALKENSKIVNTDYSCEKEGYKFSIDKIIFTPIEIKVIATKDSRFDIDFGDAGTRYRQNTADQEAKERLNKFREIDSEIDLFNMDIEDEKGNKLIPISGKGKDGEMVYVYKPLMEIPKRLVFTPRNRNNYIHEEGEDLSYSPNDDQYIPLSSIKTPFEYDQGGNMSIVINSIENNNGKTKINASINGDFIANRVSHPFQVVPKGIRFPIKPEKEDEVSDLLKSLNATSENDRDAYAEKANNTNNTFDYEYELKEDEEYNLRFRKIPGGEYIKDKQFSVNIK